MLFSKLRARYFGRLSSLLAIIGRPPAGGYRPLSPNDRCAKTWAIPAMAPPRDCYLYATFWRFEFFAESVTLLFSGAPGTTRTCDLLIRSQTLYPTELRAHPWAAILYRPRRRSATPILPPVPKMGMPHPRSCLEHHIRCASLPALAVVYFYSRLPILRARIVQAQASPPSAVIGCLAEHGYGEPLSLQGKRRSEVHAAGDAEHDVAKDAWLGLDT